MAHDWLGTAFSAVPQSPAASRPTPIVFRTPAFTGYVKERPANLWPFTSALRLHTSAYARFYHTSAKPLGVPHTQNETIFHPPHFVNLAFIYGPIITLQCVSSRGWGYPARDSGRPSMSRLQLLHF